VLVDLTKHNGEVDYMKVNLGHIRAYLKQVEGLNLMAKTKTLATTNLMAKTKALATTNLMTKTKALATINLASTTIKMLAKAKIATNLLAIANGH